MSSCTAKAMTLRSLIERSRQRASDSARRWRELVGDGGDLDLEALEERAALLEHEHGLPRHEAEQLAAAQVRTYAITDAAREGLRVARDACARVRK